MAERTILLREWDTMSPAPGTPTHGLFLPAEKPVAAGLQELKRSGVLELEELRHGLRIRSFSFVGFVSIGGLRIVVEPKIQGMPLMTLLRYAYGWRDLRRFNAGSAPIEATSLLDLLVLQLLTECQEILARGLHRRYERADERLTVPRGRLDISALAREGIVSAHLPCQHHPRLENCLHNQVLRAGLTLAAELAQDRGLSMAARRSAAVLEDVVAPIRLGFPVFERLERMMNRLTATYEPAVSLVQMLFEGCGGSLRGEGRTATLPGFFLDMNHLFQRLLGRFLRENLPEYSITEESRLRGMMTYAPDGNPLRRKAPAPRPDYCVITPRGEKLLLDAKYRDLWTKQLPREMLYQLAIYSLSQKPVGRATILYPTVDMAASESVIRIADPTTSQWRAEVVQRPVELRRLAACLSNGADAAAERREIALRLIGDRMSSKSIGIVGRP